MYVEEQHQKQRKKMIQNRFVIKKMSTKRDFCSANHHSKPYEYSHSHTQQTNHIDFFSVQLN